MSTLEPIKKKSIRQSKRLKDKDVDLFDSNSTSSTTSTNTQPSSNQQQQQQQATQSNLANQQDNGEPPFLAVGTEVSAKYKGAFCEARIKKVERLVKVRITFKNNLGTAIVIDDNIKGTLRVGASIEAKHPDKNCFLEATISKIIDASQYTVIFDDGDITTLRRSSLCLKSGKHFAESESLDHLPLTNPEHFGNPVSLNSRGNRRRRRRFAYNTTNSQFSDNEGDEESIDGSGTSVDDEDSSSILTHQSGSTTNNFKLNKESAQDELRDSDCGNVICVDYGDKRSAKLKDVWFPGLIVSPTAQEGNYKIDPKEDYLVKSFVNSRFYQLQKKDSKEFTKEMGQQILNDSVSSTSLKSAVEKALNYLERNELPSSWDFEVLIGSNQNQNTSSSILLNGDDENESSELDDFVLEEDDDLDDAKSVEEKDKFVAQLFKYMEERGTPINKTPNIWGNDLDLYNLYRLVIKFGGYNRVTTKNGWKAIYNKLSLPNNEVATSANANQLRLAYKKYLLNFVDFWRKLGCTMVDTSSTTSSRAGRGERNWMKTNWRTLSESTKQQSQQDKDLGKPTNGRRKKSTVTNETTASTSNVSKKEDDKLVKASTSQATNLIEEDNKKTIKRHHLKKGRKKFKLDQASGPIDDTNVNGNEPEEKYIPNDLDFESDNDYNSSTPSIPKDVQVTVGDRIRVKYGKGKQLKIYEAKVMNVVNADEPQSIKYYVHYTGWNTRYDEWIKHNRIVEVVCDKSPKRRGGNKLAKNKGVPVANEEKLVVSVKTESSSSSNNSNNSVSKSDSVASTSTTITPGSKRGRPPSSISTAVKNENNSTKKQIAPTISSPIKRGRARSECIEQDENIKKINDNEDSSKNSDKQSEEVKVEQDEESNKRLKRSDQEHTSDDSLNGKTVQKVEVEKRQRKKKIDNTVSNDELPPACKKRKGSTATSSTTITNNSSSGEDDSSNSSSNVANKFSKRKRISNSKYRQSSNETSTSTAKEPEMARKNSKDETSIKQEKSTSQDNESKEEQPVPTKSSTNNSKQEMPSPTPAPSTSDLLCKEEEMPASPKCSEQQSSKVSIKPESSTTNTTVTSDLENKADESQLQSSKASISLSSSSSSITIPSTSESNSQQQETVAKNKTKTTAATKLCSNNEIVNNQTDKPNNELDNQNSTINESAEKKEINEEHVQFTPPTTPESMKSGSTELNDQPEPQMKDKNESNCASSSLDVPSSTHGLDMIAIASGVTTKLDDLGESEAAAVAALTNTNFSPRKRRGRGRTISQSEREHEKANLTNVSNNLFNTSNRDNIQTAKECTASSTAKMKVCKTRGSLGRKVKSQNQINLDCNSESTSHSDNFEPNSPSMLMLSTIGIGLDYNPTSKYNFCVPLDENLEQDKRIQTLQERLQDLRKTYLNIKSELAQLERRNSRNRFRQRHKERSIPSSPGSAETNKTKTNSPSSISSNSTKDHSTLHKNSFTENSNLEDKTDCNLKSEVC